MRCLAPVVPCSEAIANESAGPPSDQPARFLPRRPRMDPYRYQIVVYPTLVMDRLFDLDLVTKAQAGDEGAFTTLLRPLIASAYRLAGAMLHDSHAAEDVVQEASLKAWRKLDQIRPGSEMKPWFLGIVANECRDVRRGSWWSVLKQSDPQTPPTMVDDSNAAFADLRHAICRLKHRRRLLLVLHWYLDLPLAEVAAITGSSEDAVKSELSRAIGQLRNLLGDKNP
jgi:RNA polymerase sigma factor (sigma-70 family)